MKTLESRVDKIFRNFHIVNLQHLIIYQIGPLMLRLPETIYRGLLSPKETIEGKITDILHRAIDSEEWSLNGNIFNFDISNPTITDFRLSLPLHEAREYAIYIMNEFMNISWDRLTQNLVAVSQKLEVSQRKLKSLEKYKTAQSDVILAARMYDYNLRNILYGAWLFSVNNEYNPSNWPQIYKDDRGVHDIVKLDIAELANLRLFGLCMAYLAAHGEDKRYLSEIPYRYLQLILDYSVYHLACHGESKKPDEEEKKMRRVLMGFPYQDKDFCGIPLQLPVIENPYSRRIKIKEMPENGFILNPEYLALWEIIKNAIDFEQPPELQIRETDKYVVISLEDNGPGILDEGGQPLRLERIHEIFGDFSTTGTGLGLNLAKRFVELREGYIEVSTKCEGYPAIKYDTKTNQPTLVTQELKRGSNFVIYIPRL